MPGLSTTVLETIQEKERELALRESAAKEDAIAILKQAEHDAEEFLREQTLRAHEDASNLYERRKAEIQKQKEDMVIQQEERLRKMEKHLQQNFRTALDQVIRWVWDVEEPQTQTAELQSVARIYE